MTWVDTVRAKALAALADRSTPARRTFASTPSNWNPHDVWLTRETPARDLAADSSVRDPATPTRRLPVLHD